MNSTPSRPKLIIVFTALPPDPPTPITLIRASYAWVSSANSIEKLIAVILKLCPKALRVLQPSSDQRFVGARLTPAAQNAALIHSQKPDLFGSGGSDGAALRARCCCRGGAMAPGSKASAQMAWAP